MKTLLATRISGLLAIALLSGCTQGKGPTITVTMPQSRNPASADVQRSFGKGKVLTAPSSFDGFNCFGLSVSGQGISLDSRVGSYCKVSSIGAMGGLAKFSGGSVSMSVPAGLSRTVQLLGIVTPDGTCPTLDNLSTYVAANGYPLFFTIGQTTTDILSDTSVSIQGAYDQNNPVQVLTNCATPPLLAVSSITPAFSSPSGSQSVTISGQNFQSSGATVASVTIGGSACTGLSVTGNTSLTCTAPTGSLGAVDVVVTLTDGRTTTLSGGYTYYTPTVGGITSQYGSTAGGQTVTVTGAGFKVGSAVTVSNVSIGASNCGTINVTSSTTLTCVTGAQTAGTYAVTVQTSDGQAPSLASAFQYYLASVSSISAGYDYGAVSGGTSITVTGGGFKLGGTAMVSSVTIGGVVCTSLAIQSATSLTCTPGSATGVPGAGIYSLVVNTIDGQTPSLSNAYMYYTPSASLGSLSFGPVGGGQAVVINGTGFKFGSNQTVASVTLNGVACALGSITSTTINCTSGGAGGSGTGNVVVTTNDGQTATISNGYNYYTPTVTSVTSPSFGSPSGGTFVTVNGTGFKFGSAVTVQSVTLGGSPCNSVSVGSSTTLTCTTTAHTAGAVTATVNTLDGQGPSVANAFVYYTPSVSVVSYPFGPPGGGTTITLTGTNFNVTTNTGVLPTVAQVTINGGNCSSINTLSSTSLTCTVPANSAGTYDIVVHTADLQTVTLPASFTYYTPSISSISPNYGPLGGGETVTINGSGFKVGGVATINTSMVAIGSYSCGTVSVSSPTQFTCVTSSGSGSGVNVTLQTLDGQNPLPLSGAYTYQGPPAISVAPFVSPNALATTGYQPITITGSLFMPPPFPSTVTIGGLPCTGVQFPGCTSATCSTLTCLAPPATAGSQNVVVKNADNQTSSPYPVTYYAPNSSRTYLYEAGGGSGNTNVFTIDPAAGGLTSAPTGASVSTGSFTNAVAADPTGHFLYTMASSASGSIGAYAINEALGTISQIGSTGVSYANFIGVDPTGRAVLVASGTSTYSLTAYLINQSPSPGTLGGSNSYTGSTTAMNGIVFSPNGKNAYTTGYNPITITITAGPSISLGSVGTGSAVKGGSSLAIHPNGNFLFSGDAPGANAHIYVQTITPSTGALGTFATAATLASADTSVNAIAIDATGRFLYASTTQSVGGKIYCYTINPSSGGLTACTTTPSLSTPNSAAFSAIGFDPTGRFLYGTQTSGGACSSMCGIYWYKVDPVAGYPTYTSTTSSPGTGVAVTAGPTRLAYTANPGNNTVSMYSVDPGAGVLAPLGSDVSNTDATGVVVDPTGRYLYVTNTTAGYMATYSLNVNTGALTGVSDVSGGGGDKSPVVDPTGRYAFTASTGGVAPFNINPATGAAGGLAPVSAGPSGTDSIVMHPSGSYLYAISYNDNAVYEYTFNESNGALTKTNTYTVTNPVSVTMDSEGNYLYVMAHSGSMTIFTISATDGSLSGTAGPTPGSVCNYPMAVGPTSRFLFMLFCGGPGSLQNYTEAPGSGSLSGPGSTTAMGNSVAVDPSGRFVYVPDGTSRIFLFSVDPGSGATTAPPGAASFPASAGPTVMTLSR